MDITSPISGLGMSVKRTNCVVKIDGADISSALFPYLIKLSVSDKAGISSDTASIDLDDSSGDILLPPEKAKIEILLGSDLNGSSVVFKGVVDSVKSKGSRSSGRTLTISAKGYDEHGKAKQQRRKHWDNAPLSTVMADAGKLAGIANVIVDPDLGKLVRKYWAMQGESFIHFGQRIAKEIGATFKVADTTAIMAQRNGGKSASGLALPSIRAAWGENLISWEIEPFAGRGRFKKTKARWYDRKAAEWKEESLEIEDDDVEAEYSDRYTAADQDEAKAATKSRKADVDRSKGGGTVTIDGTAAAQPEANLILVGARDGIDGEYRIDTVDHDYDRSSGWTTNNSVKQPQGSAGKDSRAKK